MLCVVVPTAPIGGFLDRFVAAAAYRINQIPVAAELRAAETEALHDIQVDRTASRSVLSSMTQFKFAVEAWLASEHTHDLEALGLWLCDTPCSPLSTHWPWLEAELLLSGAVSPTSRGAGPLTNVI